MVVLSLNGLIKDESAQIRSWRHKQPASSDIQALIIQSGSQLNNFQRKNKTVKCVVYPKNPKESSSVQFLLLLGEC